MKKIKFLALTALFTMLGTNAFADMTNGTLKFAVVSGTNVQITGYATTVAAADKATLTIEPTITDATNATSPNYKIVAIADEAFKNQTAITSVVIAANSNLESIGARAFQGCSALASINFANAVKLTAIGVDAFKGTILTQLDLSATHLGVVNNLFGTSPACDAIAYTAATATTANTAKATETGTTLATTGTAISAANAKYYNSKLAGALPNDGSTLLTAAQANAYNASLTGAMVNDGSFIPGAATTPTLATVKTYNAGLDGAFDFSVGGTYVAAGPVYTAAGAAIYNYVIYPALNDGAAIGTPKAADNDFAEADDVDAYNATKTNAIPIDGTAVPAAKANVYNLDVTGAVANDGTGIVAIANADTYNAALTGAWATDGSENFTDDTAAEFNTLVGYVAAGDIQYPAKAAVTNNKLEGVKLPGGWWTTFNNTVLDNGAQAGVFENCIALKSIDFGTVTKATAFSVQAFKGTALESVTIPAKISSIAARAFENCDKLATVTFAHAASNAFTGIGTYAFSNIAAQKITIPASLPATTEAGGAASSVAQFAFADCPNLTAFTYMPTIASGETVVKVVDAGAFLGCPNDITFYTVTNYKSAAANASAPTKCTFAADGATADDEEDGDDKFFEPVQNKANTAKYFLKLKAESDLKVKKADAKVYAAYTDDGAINMQLFKAKDGFYHIAAGDVVLLISDKDSIYYSTTSVTNTTGQGTSWLPIASDFGVVKANNNELNYLTSSKKRSELEASPNMLAGYFIYGYVNTASGCGFQKITGGTNFPAKTLFIYGKPEEAAAGRMNIVWRDEDGNIESEATAIRGIEEAVAEDGVIYSLQGARVNNAQKGVFIKNGKKVIVK